MPRSQTHSTARRVLVILCALMMLMSLPAGVFGTVGAEDPPEPTPGEPQSFFGDIEFSDGEPVPNGTEVFALINGSVQDSITVEEAGQYGGPNTLDERLDVDTGAGDEVVFRIGSPDGLQAVESPFDLDKADRTPFELDLTFAEDAFFDVTVDAEESRLDVVDGEQARIVADVENVGNTTGAQNIDATLADEEIGTIEGLSLDPGDEEQVEFTFTPDTDDDGADVTVASNNDAATETLSVTEQALFDVAIDDVDPDEVTAGDDVTVEYTIENIGELNDTQDIRFTVDGELEATESNVSLDRDDEFTDEFTYTTADDDPPEVELEVASNDDSADETVAVIQPPTFEVDVIEAESNLNVTAGQTASVVAEIENVGDQSGTQTITLTNVTDGTNDELTDEAVEFTLAPDETRDFEADIETTENDGNTTLSFEVASDDDEEAFDVEVRDDPAFFDVAIDDISPDPVEEPATSESEDAEEVTVDATVENLGTENVTQEVIFSEDGEQFDSEEVTLDGDETEHLTASLDVEEGDAPEIDIRVASDDDAATETLNVTPLPEFTVSIIDPSNVSQPIPDDGEFTPAAINVTNVGEQDGDATLDIEFNGTSEGTHSVDDLEGGNTTTITDDDLGFTINVSDIDTGDRLLEALIDNERTNEIDDSSTSRVTIGDAPDFQIDDLDVDPDDTVDRGDTVTITVDLNNTGEVTSTEPVIVEFGDRQIELRDVQLDGESQTTEQFDFRTRSGDVGPDRELIVTTPDDEATDTLDVQADAEFLIDDFEIDTDTIAGESAEVTADIENVGGLAGNETEVRLSVDGAEDPDVQSIELANDSSTEVTFEITPDDAGTLEATIATDDDFDVATTDVGTPGELVTEIRSVTDPIEDGEDIEVVVRAENVGDGEVTGEFVDLVFDGSTEDDEIVSLAGGDSERVTLSTTIDLGLEDGDSTEETIVVEGGVEAVSETFTVQELEGPFFRVSNLDIEDDDVLNQTQTLAVTADITNAGDETDTQDINFTVGDVTETNESVELDEGEGTTVEFDFDPTDVGATGDIDYAVASENQTVSDTLQISEPEDGTPAIVDVEFDDAEQDEPFVVNVTVENVGDLDLDGNETVTLDAVGETDEQAINESETIGSGDTEEVTLTVTPEPEARAGEVERAFEVSTDDGEDTVSETVLLDFDDISSGLDALDGESGTVLVEPGTYDERSTIAIDTDDVTIEPTEGDVTIEPPRGDDETAISIEASDVELSDLTFAGDGTGTAIELVDDADDVTLTDLRIEDWETGVDETAGTNTFIGLDIVDSGDAGLILAGDGESTVEFTRVARADSTGILVDSDDVEIFGSTINRASVGIDAFGQATIEETTIRNADEYGLRVTDVPEDGDDISANITDSNLESNSLSVLADNSTVDAEGNWWGQVFDEGEAPEENVDWATRSTVFAEDPRQSRQDSDLTVTVTTDAPDPAVRGETFEVEATIENEGTATDRQEIELVDDGRTLDDTEVNLAGGESEDVEFSYEPTPSDSSLELDVLSLDDEAGAPDGEVDVVDPAEFEIIDIDSDDPVPLGNDLDVEVDVENTGGVTGTATVELLDFDGTVVDTVTDVEIEDGNVEPSTLTWTTDQTGTDDVTVNVRPDGGMIEDTETETVTVEDAALVDVDLNLADTELEIGDETTTSVSATFTDGSSQDVTSAAVIESNNPNVATVSGNTITAEGEGTAEISAVFTQNGETQSDTVDLTVDEADVAPRTGGGTGGAVVIPAPDDQIEFTTTRSESIAPRLDTTTDRQVATFQNLDTVLRISFETSDRIDNVAAGDIDLTAEELTAPGALATASEISVPDAVTDTPATIEFRVSADRLDAIDADADDLTAFRATNGEWETLDTTVETDGDDVVVTADTPGFSVFAVSATSEPDAIATVSPQSVTEGEEVTLDGSDSTDEYGEIVEYEWTLDDETLTGETVTTTLDDPGEYTAELTVTNDAGETDTDTVDLVVTEVEDDDEAVFEVSNLDPVAETVDQGDLIDVSATIINTGDADGAQTVELRIDGDTVDATEVDLAAGADRTVEFTNIDTDGLEGELEHGVFTEDDSQTGTLTVEVPDDDEPTDDVDDTVDADDGIPGFGVIVALLALLLAAGILTRRE